MSPGQWRPLDPSRARALRDARRQTHHASQMATALGISYLEPRDDDSHTNLEWLPQLDALASNPVATGTLALRVALNVVRLELVLLRDGRALAAQPLHGKTVDQAAAWLRDQLGRAGLDPAAFTLQCHYQIPDHAVAHGTPFDTTDQEAFAQLANWFHDGTVALETLRQAQPRASEVRVWPHHFDAGVVVDLGKATSVGAGLEPGDVYYDEPYFYVNMRPAPSVAALPSLAAGGQWHTREWIGAVLPASRMAPDTAAQERQATEFLNSALGAALRLVGGNSQ